MDTTSENPTNQPNYDKEILKWTTLKHRVVPRACVPYADGT